MPTVKHGVTLHAEDGVVLEAARRQKERTFPGLAARGGRARLVVLGVEVGGRWSTETPVASRCGTGFQTRWSGCRLTDPSSAICVAP